MSRVLSTHQGTRQEAFGPAEWALLAGVAIVWGSSFLFIDIALEAFPPAVIALFRLCFGGAALGALGAARRRLARGDWPRVAVLGITWMALPLIVIPIAQQWIDSSLAGMLNASMPLFSAVVGALMLRRWPGARQSTGLLVGFAGVAAVSWPALQGARTTAIGALLVLAATLSYGFSVNVAVPLQQRYGSLPVMFRVQLVAIAATLPLGLWELPHVRFAWGPLLAVAALGLLGTGVAFVAMATLVGRVGATRGSVAIYFLPVVAIVLGVVFLSERVGPAALAGTGLVIAGAWLVTRAERATLDRSVATGAAPGRHQAAG